MPTPILDWDTASWTGLTAGLATFTAALPSLAGAAVIVLLGWLAGSLLAVLALRLLEAARFDAYLAHSGLEGALQRAGVRLDPAAALAALVKWSVRLVALWIAADVLHLPAVAAGLARVLGYLPNVAAALAILAGGWWLAGVVARLIRGLPTLRTRELVARAAQATIAAIAALAALGQLAIAPALVQTLDTALIAAVALAAALAFGLGLRDQARDVVAGHALAEHLHEGDEITVDQVRGRVARIGTLKTLVHTGDGFTSIPNHVLIDVIFRVHGHRIAPLGGGGGGGGRSGRPPSWRPPS